MDEHLNSLLIEVLNAYKALGILKLADYQREIIENIQFYPPNSKNLLLSAPTGSGKNLVAEILAILNARLTGRKCIFILPYIAAAQEVFFNLQQIWREFGLGVKAHFGPISINLNEEFDAIICTIEKSAAFINRLFREDKLDEYCCIVIDEVHMLLDSDRGGLLEDLILKLNYYKSIGRPVPQLLTLSATLESPEKICKFIDATFIEHTLRLNNLEQCAIVDKKLYKIDYLEAESELNSSFNIASDTNAVIGLTIEALIEQKPVLIFCMTKVCVEQTADLISRYITFCNSKAESRFPQLRKLGSLEVETFSNKIGHLLKNGVAYHHSGLSSDDRSNIERLYKQGQIKVIACTSTLSTGVNLPATRVIIRLDQGPMNINYISYNQMIGRCGRLGYEAGQAFIIAQNVQKLVDIWRLIKKRPFTQVKRDYTQLILDAVVLKIVTNKEECQLLLASTIQKPISTVENIIDYLISQKFLYTFNKDEQIILVANQLSLAASQSFLRPSDALFIFIELEKASKNLCLDTELHLAYLITPLKHKLGIDVGKISWDRFFNLFDKLPSEYLRVASLVGITQSTCVDALNGTPKETLVRFYMALILMETLQGIPVKQTLKKYDFKLADLEILRDQAVLYARTVVNMCDYLAWPYLKNVLSVFTKKLELWANPEICDLMKIKGMDGTRARSFIECGITTSQELAIVELSTVERILRHAVPFLIDANNNGDQNEWLMNEKFGSCGEAAEILVERAQQLIPIQQDSMPSTKTNESRNLDILSQKFPPANEIDEIELDESMINQLDQNILLDVTMESVFNLCEMTAELSIIEFENDENQRPLNDKESKCMIEFLSNTNYVVFELIGNQFTIIPDNETSLFIIQLDPNSDCSNGCCSTDAMLETFLFNKSIKKYSYNLSSTFYNAFKFLSKLEVCHQINAKNLLNFHCILSQFRSRLKRPPQLFELLDAEVRKWAISFLSKEEDLQRKQIKIFLISLSRLISRVLLQSNSYLKVENEIGQNYNECVTTSILMTYRGFAFNSIQYQKLLNFLLPELTNSEKAAWKVAGEPFNLHNCRATRQVLDKLGIPSSGKSTTTITELEHINHPIAPLIVRARRLANANKVLRELNSMIHEDGRIHPYYNCLNSYTGRIFAEQPQIQFVPKECFLNGESCRSVFCASRGSILLSLDFKQVELRMLAALSEDKNLCQMLKQNLDPFEKVAPNRPFSRDHKKKMFYALLYGMGKKSLAQELNCSIDEADRVINDIFQNFQGVRIWLEDVATKATKDGFVQSLWNLSVSTKNLTVFEVRQKAPHFIIQASTSEMIRKKMNDVERSLGDEIGLVLQMHDEFIMEVRKDRAEQCAEVVKKLMEFEVNGIRFPVQIKQGSNWGNLT